MLTCAVTRDKLPSLSECPGHLYKEKVTCEPSFFAKNPRMGSRGMWEPAGITRRVRLYDGVRE